MVTTDRPAGKSQRNFRHKNMFPRQESLQPDFFDQGLRPLSVGHIFRAALSWGAAMKAGTEADSMQERPTTFGDLLRRIAPGQAARKQSELSLAASAVPLHGELAGNLAGGISLPGPPFSVVLHSVTTRGMRLTHTQPMSSKQIAVRISLITGEMIQVLLSVGRSRKTGDLYETQARFIPDETKAPSSAFKPGAGSESDRHYVASVGSGD